MTNTILAAIAALIMVESGDDPRAIGDSGAAVGVLQFHKVAVDEANRIAATNRWTYADRLDPAKSRAMCWTTLEFHYRRGTTDPVQLAGKHRNPYSRCPEWYLDRVRKELRRSHE